VAESLSDNMTKASAPNNIAAGEKAEKATGSADAVMTNMANIEAKRAADSTDATMADMANGSGHNANATPADETKANKANTVATADVIKIENDGGAKTAANTDTVERDVAQKFAVTDAEVKTSNVNQSFVDVETGDFPVTEQVQVKNRTLEHRSIFSKNKTVAHGIPDSAVGRTINAGARVPAAIGDTIPPDDRKENIQVTMVRLMKTSSPDHMSGLAVRDDNEPTKQKNKTLLLRPRRPTRLENRRPTVIFLLDERVLLRPRWPPTRLLPDGNRENNPSTDA